MNLEKIKNDPRMPQHIAVIIDGNGRWAKCRGLTRSMGHRAGYDNVFKLIESVEKLGIKNLSIYAFSSENWKRPKEEVDYLMKLFDEILDKFASEYMDKNIKIVISGDMNDTRIPKISRDKAKQLVELTRNKTGLVINPCFNYGGRQEILKAVREIVENNERDISETEFSRHLYTSELLPLDLIIRTSGELRSSNFMPWQSTYSEWYYTKTLWPSFTEKHLIKAIKDYMKRNRRFGALKG